MTMVLLTLHNGKLGGPTLGVCLALWTQNGGGSCGGYVGGGTEALARLVVLERKHIVSGCWGGEKRMERKGGGWKAKQDSNLPVLLCCTQKKIKQKTMAGG